MEKPATPQHDLGPLRDAVLKAQDKLICKQRPQSLSVTDCKVVETRPRFAYADSEPLKPYTPHLNPLIVGLSMAYVAGAATVLIALEIML